MVSKCIYSFSRNKRAEYWWEQTKIESLKRLHSLRNGIMSQGRRALWLSSHCLTWKGSWEETPSRPGLYEGRTYFTVKCLHISFILVDLCTSYSERPNLQLYRDRFAVHKELHSGLQGERPARWPCCLSWHILMWLGTMNRCCPVVTAQTGYAALCWPGRCLPHSPVNFTVLCYGLRIHS